jgi:hypothetical protein
MPRELKQLPKWGYATLLNAPTIKGRVKTDKVWDDGKMGMNHRKNGNLDYKGVGRRQPVRKPFIRRGDIIRYDVSCTVCLDMGCDKCPTIQEEK